MPSIIYSEERSAGAPIPYHRINATGGYLRHYENFRLLSFIADESKDGAERAQARKEIVMARDKMSRLEKHPNFDRDEVQRGVERINGIWIRQGRA